MSKKLAFIWQIILVALLLIYTVVMRFVIGVEFGLLILLNAVMLILTIFPKLGSYRDRVRIEENPDFIIVPRTILAILAVIFNTVFSVWILMTL